MSDEVVLWGKLEEAFRRFLDGAESSNGKASLGTFRRIFVNINPHAVAGNSHVILGGTFISSKTSDCETAFGTFCNPVINIYPYSFIVYSKHNLPVLVLNNKYCRVWRGFRSSYIHFSNGPEHIGSNH